MPGYLLPPREALFVSSFAEQRRLVIEKQLPCRRRITSLATQAWYGPQATQTRCAELQSPKAQKGRHIL
jgi:hypothetical protein